MIKNSRNSAQLLHRCCEVGIDNFSFHRRDMADAKGENPETSQDLTIFVQNLLEQMVHRFFQIFFSPLKAKSIQPNVNHNYWQK
jgi:hypothetical protein